MSTAPSGGGSGLRERFLSTPIPVSVSMMPRQPHRRQPVSNHESDGDESDEQPEVINSAKTGPSDGEVMPGPVGYRRPPKHTQFVKGRSGNPNGRTKGSKNFGLVIEEELNTKIPINENGKRKSITKREAAAKQLVNKAASGDAKAIPILLNEARAREKAGIDLGPDAN